MLAQMIQRCVDRSAEWLSARTDRRGFLSRTALAGTALAVAPGRYILRPVAAYQAICNCSGYECDCAAQCCDGYTEFCCTVYGSNTCPPGTLAAGWWKADGSGFCGGAPRYYLDCNASCGPCSCESSGLCAGSCSGTGCGCANGSCANRKSGCTQFRYGQCNQDVECVGPIVCRVVTCTPPWLVDSACESSPVLTDNNTRFHDAACLHDPPPSDTSEFLPIPQLYSILDPGEPMYILVHDAHPTTKFLVCDSGAVLLVHEQEVAHLTSNGVETVHICCDDMAEHVYDARFAAASSLMGYGIPSTQQQHLEDWLH